MFLCLPIASTGLITVRSHFIGSQPKEASDRSRPDLFHPTRESAAVRYPSIIPYCLPGEDLLRTTARVRRQCPSMGHCHPTTRVPDPLSIVPFHLPMKASLLAMVRMRNRFPSMGLSHPTMRGANQVMILHPSVVRHQLRADLRLARVREHLSCLRMTGSVHLTKVKEPYSGVRFRLPAPWGGASFGAQRHD